eukprot:549343-Prorocentrum_minimum.AAC.2
MARGPLWLPSSEPCAHAGCWVGVDRRCGRRVRASAPTNYKSGVGVQYGGTETFRPVRHLTTTAALSAGRVKCIFGAREQAN